MGEVFPLRGFTDGSVSEAVEEFNWGKKA